MANSIFGQGDAASLSPATITAGSAAVFLAELMVAVPTSAATAAATVAATVAMPRTPVEHPGAEIKTGTDH